MAAVQSQHGDHHRNRHRHPSTLGNFIQNAPWIMKALMMSLDLSPVQAAAIVGNLGTESADFTATHEKGQRANRGGYGWAQWTGARRSSFFAWSDAHRLPRDSYAASLGYFEYELKTTQRHVLALLKKQTDLRAATHTFMRKFENPGIANENSRLTHADLALKAFEQQLASQTPSAK